MPKNITGLGAGTVQTNNVNNPNVDHMRGRNLFPQSYMHPSTCRYGEVDLVGAIKCERGDIFPYKFDTDLNTFTMASPLKSEVNMMSAAFKVPMKALYPRNWDIMMPFPNKGDDVPDDTRALLNVGSLSNSILAGIRRFKDSNTNLFNAVRNTFLLELIYSAGSIFAKANQHYCSKRAFVVVNNASPSSIPVSFDKFFDTHFAPWLRSLLSKNVVLEHYANETPSYRVTDDPNLISTKFSANGYYISMRRAFELLRTGEYLLSSDENLTAFINTFPYWNLVGGTGRYNIEPIIAYKSACSHFFTNPKIDFVYSWELFRDAMQSLLFGEDGRIPTFVWNGVNKQYDVFSEHCMAVALSALTTFNDDYFNHSSFWFNLLSWSRSLRYGDYFTGVHPEPLAVGDVNAPVTDASVNAIEMVEKIQLARLLNKVNIAGPRKDDQLVAMYGGPLPEAPKDVPIRLSLEKFDVSGFEVNNTAELQADSIEDSSKNITTTNLRLTESRFMFEVAIDEPCWLVVVQYFEAHRIYSNTMDRFAFHRDRFDDFQPDLQYIGDQEVYTQELDAANGSEVPFAYNLRNMEYKQRYSYASGGFIEYLPSWLFITDNKDGNPSAPSITPDYIRSSPSEFDRFYKSLLGWSLASYFHFITTNVNVCAPYRQMIYSPEILA